MKAYEILSNENKVGQGNFQPLKLHFNRAERVRNIADSNRVQSFS